MKKVICLMIPMLLITIAILGCDLTEETVRIEGSGNVVPVEKDIADFDQIDIATAFSATITRDDSYSVVLRIDDNIVEYVNVKKSGDTLKIYLDSGSYQQVTLEANITLPDLEGLFLSGASHAEISGFDFEHDFELELSGASSASGTMNTGKVIGDLSGASRLSLEGIGEGLDIDVSGASTLSLGDFTAQNADIRLSGASQATVNLAGTLDADLSGASTLNYYGNPTMGEIYTSGASTIHKAD
jgi:hypothetical protein